MFNFSIVKFIHLFPHDVLSQGFPGGSVVRNPPDNAGDVASISESARFPGGGDCNPLLYSCLGNPVDRGAWRAAVHVVTRGWT